MFTPDDYRKAAAQAGSYTIALGGEGQRMATTRALFEQAADQAAAAAHLPGGCRVLSKVDGCDCGICRTERDRDRLADKLHSMDSHPDFEYTSTVGARKSEVPPPMGPGWQVNVACCGGRSRDDFTDTVFWRRPLSARPPAPPLPPAPTCGNCRHRLAAASVSSSVCGSPASPFYGHVWLSRAKLDGTCEAHKPVNVGR